MELARRFLQSRAGLGTPERAGVLAASTSVGRSFSRGLLPRSTADQAVITGASSALNYGLTTLSQSLIETAAFRIAGTGRGGRHDEYAHRGLVLVGDVAAMGIGVAAQRLLAQRQGESIARAWGRTFSWRLAVGGLAGAVLVGTETLLEGTGKEKRAWAASVPVALPLGALLAAAQYRSLRKRMADAGVTHDAEGVSLRESKAVAVGRSVAIGAGVTGGLLVLAEGEKLFADGVAQLVSAARPDAALLGRPIGHATGLGLLGLLGYRGLQVVFHKAEHAGDAVEAAYNEPPQSQFVSGGPASAVDWADLGREGRRFVNMALTREEITAVMGQAVADPIRVFVGLESAATTSERADLAMRELEALGAFERSLIVFMSPTGTGYLNYVASESLEFLTRGDVALVAMQYSLRPSPMSLGRVKIGIDQNNAFLHALKWRLAAIPEHRRPRLCIFGESLGAQTAQDVFAEEGVEGLHRAGIDRGLFLGTPAATKWSERWRCDPRAWDPPGQVVEVDHYEQFQALPDDVRSRARYFLLTHFNDPMPKFWFPLAVQSPSWMGPAEAREPGLPTETAWRPYITFLITLIDVKNAMNVIPGQFVAWGHDYRKDLARFTSLAYRLPATPEQLDRIERVLRQRELQWAERRLIDEQLANAQQQVQQTLSKWGVPDQVLPSLVPNLEHVDPYQAIAAQAPTADEGPASPPPAGSPLPGAGSRPASPTATSPSAGSPAAPDCASPDAPAPQAPAR